MSTSTPVSGLADSYGRVATDLRVSLTDRCNLRCNYCMPAEGLDWLPTEDTLTDDEVVRLVRIGVEQLGIREVRFTGGEPLLRPGLVGIVERCAALEPRPSMSLTTNGIGLKRTAAALKEAGASFADVVRVHYLLPIAADFERCWPAMGKVFGEVRPACTMMVVALADPRMKIEIEVTALVRGKTASKAAKPRAKTKTKAKARRKK